MKSKICLLIGLMISCVALSGCVSDSQYDELEKRVSYLESLQNIEEEKTTVQNETLDEKENTSLNSYFKDATGIALFYEYDTKEDGWHGDYYLIVLRDNKCVFNCLDKKKMETVSCDYSEDIFYEVLDSITSQKIEKYENEIDEKGMIVYETVPRILGVYVDGKEGYVLINDPDNINDIVKKFEDLKNHAFENIQEEGNEEQEMSVGNYESDGSNSLVPDFDDGIEHTIIYE